MIYRTNVPAQIETAVAGHHGPDFVASDWLNDLNNIALVNEKGDVNLFQYEYDGCYFGHFFYQSRGKEAVKVAKEMLDAIFRYEDVQVLMGLTPTDKLGARWLTRKLGFKSHGIIETVNGRCEMFVLSRPEYEKDNT